MSPPFGFLFDLRSLNLTVVLAVAFFFAGAILMVGCDVIGCAPPFLIGDAANVEPIPRRFAEPL